MKYAEVTVPSGRKFKVIEEYSGKTTFSNCVRSLIRYYLNEKSASEIEK